MLIKEQRHARISAMRAFSLFLALLRWLASFDVLSGRIGGELMAGNATCYHCQHNVLMQRLAI